MKCVTNIGISTFNYDVKPINYVLLSKCSICKMWFQDIWCLRGHHNQIHRDHPWSRRLFEIDRARLSQEKDQKQVSTKC